MSEYEKRRAPNKFLVHRGCGGFIIFAPQGEGLPNERTCRGCGRRETYELNQLVIVGRPEISDKTLESFCSSLKVGMLGVQQSKINPSIFVATIKALDQGKNVHPDEWVKERTTLEEYEKVVFFVTRKPVAFDGSGVKIQDYSKEA